MIVFTGPADRPASMGHRGSRATPRCRPRSRGSMRTTVAPAKAPGTLTSDAALARRFTEAVLSGVGQR